MTEEQLSVCSSQVFWLEPQRSQWRSLTLMPAQRTGAAGGGKQEVDTLTRMLHSTGPEDNGEETS